MSCADCRCRWSDQPGPEVELVELGGERGGRVGRRQPLGDLLGDGVHRRARPCGVRVRRRLGTDRAEHPPQRAALEGLDRRRAHPHRRPPRAPAARRRTAGPAPTSVDGAAPGTPSSASRRSTEAAADRRCGRGLRIGERAAQLGHQRRQRQRARQLGERPARPPAAAPTRSRKREAVAPASAPSRAPSHGGDDQPAPRAGAGDVEEPPLLGEGERPPVDRRCRRCRRPARPAPRCRAATCARAGRARRPPARRRRRRGPTPGPWRRAR